MTIKNGNRSCRFLFVFLYSVMLNLIQHLELDEIAGQARNDILEEHNCAQ
jgi:hypothetical protein